jgi:hypothetical protein
MYTNTDAMVWHDLDSFGLKIPDFKILDPPLACVCVLAKATCTTLEIGKLFLKKKVV